MKMIAITLAASLAFGSAAFAGGVNEATADAVVIGPAATLNWTGPYAGASIGKGEAAGGLFSEDAFGVFAGYRYDLGKTVIGGEVAYNNFKTVDTFQVKGQFGLDAGRFLPYVTAGYNTVEFAGATVDGAVYGIGLDYAASSKVTVGAEYLRADVNGVDLDTLALRAAFRF